LLSSFREIGKIFEMKQLRHMESACLHRHFRWLSLIKRRFPHLGPNNTMLGELVTFTILYTAVCREYKSFDIC